MHFNSRPDFTALGGLHPFPRCVRYASHEPSLAYLVPRRSRGSTTVSLLARVTRLRRAAWRRSVAALRSAGGSTGRRSVLLLLLAVVGLSGTAVASLLWRRAAVTALGRGSAGVSLLVLGVVRRVDGAEDELQDPEVGGEVDRWVGTSHLGGLVLEVGRDIDQVADGGVVIELAEEFGG